ncbi:MAG: glycosyltransferase [Arenicellales bacterium]
MQISVIIPTFNRAHTLKRALDSVLAQQYLPAEIIVVDDGSEDETQSLLEGYPNIVKFKQASNLGVSAARNTGIAEAKYLWLAFLDSDDEWLPEKLEKQVEAAEHYPEISIFHTDEIWIRNGKRVNAMKKHAKPDGWVYSASLPLCCVSPSSVLLHRKVLEQCGGFDTDFPACEDYDLWLRLFNQFPVKLIDEQLLVKYGGHKDQLSHQHWGMDRFRVKALDKILKSHALKGENRALTVQMLQEKCHILINGAEKRGHTELAEQYTALASRYA